MEVYAVLQFTSMNALSARQEDEDGSIGSVVEEVSDIHKTCPVGLLLDEIHNSSSLLP